MSEYARTSPPAPLARDVVPSRLPPRPLRRLSFILLHPGTRRLPLRSSPSSAQQIPPPPLPRQFIRASAPVSRAVRGHQRVDEAELVVAGAHDGDVAVLGFGAQLAGRQ